MAAPFAFRQPFTKYPAHSRTRKGAAHRTSVSDCKLFDNLLSWEVVQSAGPGALTPGTAVRICPSQPQPGRSVGRTQLSES